MPIPLALFLLADISFQRQVQPILAERCQACHRDTAALLRNVKPGDAAGSKFFEMISGATPKMPKAGKPLTTEQVETIRQWIAQGAKQDGAIANQPWWSLSPLKPAAAGSIDSFLRAKLAEKKLTPSPEAGRRALIRRVTFDLHGLPPTPAEVTAFESDRDPQAYEKLVDRLLASPRYGERWARHWLDVVHYGDTHGYDKDKPRANAWPYRDYVIRAFNEDKPYARFVEEQIAGDALFPDDANALIATGFIAAGPWDFVGHQELREGTTDKNITRLLDRDDMVAATMSTFTSMTAHCARCHDHKFDPIKQADYYSLQSVFAGVDRADRPYDTDPALHRQRQQLLKQKRDVYIDLQPLLDKVEFATSPEIVALDDRIQDAKLLLAHMGQPKSDAEAAEKKRLQDRVDADTRRRKELVDAIVGAETYTRITALKEQAAKIDESIAALPKPQLVYAAANYFPVMGRFRPSLTPRPIHVLMRGSVENPGAPAQPGTLSCVPAMPARFELADANDEGSRRAALAKWITHRDNTLTWRSIVNRVWHYHFGAGLVDTPNDFGRMGSQPTHPELLDWLAVWFRDDAGGSLKKLHRLIVTSAAYRQSSKPRAEAAAIDADNRLLWRMNRIRLDAETVRDSVLAISGKLDLTQGGPPVRMFFFKDDHSPVYDYARFDVDADGAYRRSIYRFIVRSVPDPFMDRLDCPDPSLLTPKRNTTLTAIQALALRNNQFMVRMAEHVGARARTESKDAVAFLGPALFSRQLTADEARDFQAYAAQHGLENLVRLLFNTNEFLFAD